MVIFSFITNEAKLLKPLAHETRSQILTKLRGNLHFNLRIPNDIFSWVALVMNCINQVILLSENDTIDLDQMKDLSYCLASKCMASESWRTEELCSVPDSINIRDFIHTTCPELAHQRNLLITVGEFFILNSSSTFNIRRNLSSFFFAYMISHFPTTP